MPVNPAHRAVWMQVAKMQDYSLGLDGTPLSEMPESPIGQEVWFSETARKAGNRSDDLAEGYAQLIGMRVELLERGLNDTAFVRTAAMNRTYGPLYRWILERFLNYHLAEHGL
ncbi:MAG: hypothetical protein ACYCW6_31345 [Candidatus Xenobia bacterium]